MKSTQLFSLLIGYFCDSALAQFGQFGSSGPFGQFGQQSRCFTERANAQTRNGALGGGLNGISDYVPECEFNGDYKAKQCQISTGQCWCAAQDGTRIPGTVKSQFDTVNQQIDCLAERVRFNSGSLSGAAASGFITSPGLNSFNSQCTLPAFGRACTARIDLCQGDASCTSGQRCCFNGCYNECQWPDGVSNRRTFGQFGQWTGWAPQAGGPNAKAGTCPIIQNGLIGNCLQACDRDSDCAGLQKCCSNGCGKECRNPVDPFSFTPTVSNGQSVLGFGTDVNRLGQQLQCPANPAFSPCEARCRDDTSCPLGYKCCRTGCGGQDCIVASGATSGLVGNLVGFGGGSLGDPCASNPCPFGQACVQRQIQCSTLPCNPYDCRIPKIGQCPSSPLGGQSAPFGGFATSQFGGQFCRNDYDCPDVQKCCWSGGGSGVQNFNAGGFGAATASFRCSSPFAGGAFGGLGTTGFPAGAGLGTGLGSGLGSGLGTGLGAGSQFCADPNARFDQCNGYPSCQESCDTLGRVLQPCAASCVAGCVCRDGFVRRSQASDQCVVRADCGLISGSGGFPGSTGSGGFPGSSLVSSGIITQAIAVFSSSTSSAGIVQGSITFSQTAGIGPVSLSGTLRGLSPGEHGFHVHELGDLTNGCLSTAAHFNPASTQHGGPSDTARHVGDLGNILVDASGVATVTLSDARLSLNGPNSIVGRALVVHERVDDLGRGADEESKKTGNAGGRLGCAIIGIKQTQANIPIG